MPITGPVTDYTDDLRLAHVLADDADSLTQAAVQGARPARDDQARPHAGHRRRPGGRGGHPPHALAGRAPATPSLGEEQGSTGHSQRRWVVDPIDGTKNFVRGVPVWATLIALVVDDEVVARRRVGARCCSAAGGPSKGGGAWTGRSLLQGDAVPGLRRTPPRGRLAVLLLARPAGTSAAGSTTSSRCRAAAGAPGRTATSGPTCCSPRAPSTSPPSPSSSSTTWRRST